LPDIHVQKRNGRFIGLLFSTNHSYLKAFKNLNWLKKAGTHKKSYFFFRHVNLVFAVEGLCLSSNLVHTFSVANLPVFGSFSAPLRIPRFLERRHVAFIYHPVYCGGSGRFLICLL